MDQATWVLLVVLLLATGFGVWRTARDGRFRGTHAVKAAQPVTAAATMEAAAAQPAKRPQPATQDDSAKRDHPARRDHPLAALGHDLGERATLLQFSSAFCAPCRATRRVLADVAGVVPGVTHVEVDAEKHLDLVRRLGILRTPTTLVLDGSGAEVSRASGAPTKAAVLATLGRTLDD
jgi:thiol-disulfide isomerase/thioredoxin